MRLLIIFAEKYCIIKSKTRSLIKYKGYFLAEKQESVNEKAKNKVLYKRCRKVWVSSISAEVFTTETEAVAYLPAVLRLWLIFHP